MAYIHKFSKPIRDSFITLKLNFSGYRNKDTQELIITTDYLNVLEYSIQKDKTHLIDEKNGNCNSQRR